jgi:hypothetical protein
MGVPAPLSRKLRDKLGSETGEALVTWLEEMRAEHVEQLARIDERMGAMEIRLTERIHRVELRVGEVQSNLMKWSFLFSCGAVAAIAGLAGVLRQ